MIFFCFKDTIGILILLFLIQISLNYLNMDIFRQSWSFKRDYDVITEFFKKIIFAASSSQEGVFTTKIFFSEYLAHRLSNDVSHDHFKSFWCKMVILTTYSEKWPWFWPRFWNFNSMTGFEFYRSGAFFWYIASHIIDQNSESLFQSV